MEPNREIRINVASELIAALFIPGEDGTPIVFDEKARMYLEPIKFAEHIQTLAPNLI